MKMFLCFDRLDKYHSKIELNIEENLCKFLEAKLTNICGANKFNVYQKNRKLPSPWISKTPKRYKPNTINGDTHRSKRISSNFDGDIPLIKEKFMKADYPLCFINSVVNEFQRGKECGDQSFTIPPSLLEILKCFIFVQISYCEMNEIKLKQFLKKFHKFIRNSYRMVITWRTRNIQSLFPLKDKNDYKLCYICKGDCSCGSCNIIETKRNV